MSSHEDSPFYDSGYTTPDQGEEFHVARLEKQQIDKVSTEIGRRAARKTRPSGHVQDFENDGYHADEMAAFPPDFVDEPYDGDPIEEPRLVARIIARRNHEKSVREQFGVDSPEYSRLQRYNNEHPLLPDVDHPKGA